MLMGSKVLLCSLLCLSLTDPQFIEEELTKSAHWGFLHGARQEDLGAGMLYYGLAYSKKAKCCVCLGSGDGFVPRVMRQAQRDLHIENSKTILVDGNIGRWGRPEWLSQKSFFRNHYPEIEIVLNTTKNVSMTNAREWQIDYLHIDADRTVKGAMQDFIDYLPFMAKNGVITLHDTGPLAPCSHVVTLLQEQGYHVVNFETLGTGVAIISLH